MLSRLNRYALTLATIGLSPVSVASLAGCDSTTYPLDIERDGSTLTDARSDAGQSDAVDEAQQCPSDLSAPADGQADSGPSECTAPDGAREPCPCVWPDGGPVDVCGPGGNCVVGPICTPGGCIGGWVCSYQTNGCGELISSLCSRSCGVLTVNQAAQVSDAVVCTGGCVRQTDAATDPWVCASGPSFSCGTGGPGDQ
jgi:hypothetical protein